jgi:hypothetical protein
MERAAGEIAAMIDHVTGNKALPKSIRQDIIERTDGIDRKGRREQSGLEPHVRGRDRHRCRDGIPLFVEEMTTAVLEAKDEETAERTVAAVPSPSIAVPPSLHASLMARLDRLSAAKEVAQIGAAIGREFTHALLAARRLHARFE